MISVSGVTKNFDEVHALKEVNLDIATGEFVTIVGPSGCGKSTLLRIIAGLISTQGSVKKPDKGAFVFQDAALLPWRTVQKNAELLMELEDGFSKQERISRVSSALQQVGLSGFEKSYPHQLSGGMKMRLSLARALVLRPEYLLLDEPLSAVDEFLSNRVVVMSPRPGEIVHVVDVPFKKRNQLLRSKAQFTKLVSEISGKLREWK